jgi:DsbC/DsbD-like thiol-disulfide interchange protein
MIRRWALFSGAISIALSALLLTMLVPGTAVRAYSPEPNIGVSGFFSSDKAQRGRAVQAAIVLDIPGGYHVNSNRPLGKYAIPTIVKIEAPSGVRVSAVSYPRATVRRLKASNNEPLALFEGRAVMRFAVTLPANFQPGMTELRATVRYQSCNDEVCFQPETRTISLPIGVVGANDSVKRINGNIFGGRR